MQLRGLCPDSAVDSLYIPRNGGNGQVTYVSNKGNIISYDNDKSLWSFSKHGSRVTGHSKSSKFSFCLGKQTWTIENDTDGCSHGQPYLSQLKLSHCRDGQFTCNDGQCVSMKQRCDQIPDCRDKSDEENCNIVVLEKSYNKNVPPVTVRNKKVNVSISLDILKLVDIKEEDYSIEIQFTITLQWKENRATFQNLKQEGSLNSLHRKDIERLWLPEVIYENTDMKDTTRLGDTWEWETQVFVDRLGKATPSGKDIVDEINIFDGSENRLTMRQTYTRDFQCNYDFQKYPFDRQVRYMCVSF